MELREYQSKLIEESRQALGKTQRLLIVAPTGAGKTLVMAHKLRNFIEKGGSSSAVYVVHRRQLVEQTAAVLEKNGVPNGIVMAGYNTDYNNRVFVMSRDTYLRRRDWINLGRVSLLIFDEAHIGIDAQRRIAESLEAQYVLGYTATPITLNGPGMGSLYRGMVHGPGYMQLIELGHLVPTRWLVAKELDTSGLRVSRSTGDFVQEDVVNLVKGEVLADLYSVYAEHAGKRNVIFAPSVDIASTIAARLGSMGYRAAAIDWSTPSRERKRILQGFKNGVIEALVNVDVFSEGWDEPLVDTIILANPTKSLARHIQRIGRGMRPAPGKVYIRVIDLVGALRMHGTPEDIEGWELEEQRNPKEKPRIVPAVKRRGLCPRCKREMRGPVCECGFRADYIPTPADLTVVGRYVIEEHRGPREWTEDDKRLFYLQLLFYARKHNKKDGMAAHMYREKFGEWPPFKWRDYTPVPLTRDVEKYIKRRWIIWSKANSKPLWNMMKR